MIIEDVMDGTFARLQTMRQFRWRDHAAGVALCLFGLAGCACIVLRIIGYPYHDGWDLRVFWTAGTVFSQGGNPYGADFITAYESTFGPNVAHVFVYPPSWLPFLGVLAKIPYALAVSVWKLINVLCLGAGTWFWAQTLTAKKTGTRLNIFLFGLGCVGLHQATGVTLTLGQTSALMYLGMALFMKGIVTQHRLPLFIGLFLLCLKPPLGVLAVSFILCQAQYRRLIVPLAVLSSLTLTPLLFNGMLIPVITAFLQNMAGYGALDGINIAANSTGLVQFFSLIKLETLLPAISLWGIGAGCIAIWLTFGRARRPHKLPTQTALLFAALTLFSSPLHNYDMIATVLISMAFFSSFRTCPKVIMQYPVALWCIFIGIICGLRATDLAELSGLINPASTVFPGSLIASLCLGLVLVGLLMLPDLSPKTTPSSD